MQSNRYIYLILTALCFLVYANTLHNAFVSDDIGAILDYPFISTPQRFLMDPSALLNSLNYLIGKTDPFIYHLTNIILHSFNTILIYLFLRLFFGSTASLLGAGLFAVHPVHTEAVAWISGRPYTILSIFIVITYLLYRKATEKEGSRISWRYYLSSLGVFTYFIMQHLSFYSFFPFFLIFSDLIFGKWRSNWKRWIPFLGILAVRMIFARSEIAIRAISVAKEMGAGITWTNPFHNMVYSIFTNFVLLLWPARLTLYHEPPVISLFALRAETAILFILAVVLILRFRKTREVSFGIMLFIVFLTPTYSPVMVSWLVAERYLYFPSVVLSMLMAFFYEEYISTAKGIKIINLFLGLIVFVIAAYAVRTVARNEDWKTPERFWRQTVIASPDSPRAHNNMGDIYSQEGNTDAAIREFARAIELKTDYADAYHNLATTYYRRGELKEATRLYKQAVYFNPGLFESRYNLGLIYLHEGKTGLAADELRKAIELKPQDANAAEALGMALNRKQ